MLKKSEKLQADENRSIGEKWHLYVSAGILAGFD